MIQYGIATISKWNQPNHGRHIFFQTCQTYNFHIFKSLLVHFLKIENGKERKGEWVHTQLAQNHMPFDDEGHNKLFDESIL